MAQRMWQEPGFDPAKLRHIKYLGDRRRAQSGGADRALRPRRRSACRTASACRRPAPITACRWTIPTWSIAKAGTCGLPYAFVETRIADEDGNELPPGETGELWLAGPSVTPGYWNRPEENEKAFAGRWFRTGDAGRVDEDGYLYVVDRRKDMYISGGENVFPAEVEAALAEMAEIAEAAVIGVPDERWGEVGRAYLIPRDGHALDAAAVRAHCGARLAKFKVPASRVIAADDPAHRLRQGSETCPARSGARSEMGDESMRSYILRAGSSGARRPGHGRARRAEARAARGADPGARLLAQLSRPGDRHRQLFRRQGPADQVPLSDGAGEVVEVGDEVSRVQGRRPGVVDLLPQLGWKAAAAHAGAGARRAAARRACSANMSCCPRRRWCRWRPI